MIAKHINFKQKAKSDIHRLVEYITAGQDKAHRVGEVMITNCRYDDPELAAMEMDIVQCRNKRARSDKNYHLLISFRAGEEPSPETLRRIEGEICKKLGYGDHQRIAVVHRDTDNTHMHVAINKIHPKRFTMHDPFNDFRILGKACEKLEKRHYLRPDNHEKTGKTAGERKAQDIECMTGHESFLTYVRRECAEAVKAATSWDRLHRTLAKVGVTLSLRGNGMVFSDASGNRVKASDVDRTFAKGQLEKRLGAFVACPASGLPKQEKGYEKKPIGPPNPLKEEFEKERTTRDAARRERLDAVKAEYRRKAAAIVARDKVERAKARRLPASRAMKRKLYRALWEKRRRDMRRLRAETRTVREKVSREVPRTTWLSWLQNGVKGGRIDALEALRKRAFGLARKVGAAISGVKPPVAVVLEDVPDTAIDGVTKRGTVLYDHAGDCVRDDGGTFRINRGAGMDTAILTLKLAKQRFGDPLHIDGDRVFRETMVRAAVQGRVSVIFADSLLERTRKAMSQAAQQHTPTRQQRIRNER